MYKELENKIEKSKEVKKPTLAYIEKTVSNFNLETNLSKVNISIPFSDLMRNKEYKDNIIDMVRSQGEIQQDIIEVADDDPTIVFGSKIENVDDEEASPFYLSLNVLDMIVHNVMIDSSASHNLIPKGVVECLGLEVTRPYKYLYSFDSRKVECLGLIKDMVITLKKM